jgi:hypothetical protein
MLDTQELIARLEAATGPDRELDAEIFDLVGAPLPKAAFGYDLKLQPDPDAAGSYVMPVGEMMVRYEAPAYTASIDAALTLVSELADWRVGRDGEVWLEDDEGFEWFVNAPTPAIAICIAGLKARSQNHD